MGCHAITAGMGTAMVTIEGNSPVCMESGGSDFAGLEESA